MDEIVLMRSDPNWRRLFESKANKLQLVLAPELRLRVEHFGSTAVPGLLAKPIIDILVGVRTLKQAMRDAVPALDAIEYSFWADTPDKTRLFFVKGLPPNGPRTHHIHMAEMDSPLWERLLFRDYLCKHADEAERYAKLKRTLISQFQGDREAYTEGKTDYVAEVMKKARLEFIG